MKFVKFMNEEKLPANIDEILEEIKEAVDENEHTYSVILLTSKILKNNKLTSALEHVQGLNEFFGHMPSGLIKIRNEIMDMAMEQAKKKFPEYAEKIYQSF